MKADYISDIFRTDAKQKFKWSEFGSWPVPLYLFKCAIIIIIRLYNMLPNKLVRAINGTEIETKLVAHKNNVAASQCVAIMLVSRMVYLRHLYNLYGC